MKQKREAGFSLLELLVVVAITFVIAAMATPQIITAMAKYRLKSSASELAVLIQRCRMEAVKRNQVVGLQQVTDATGRDIVFFDTPGTGHTDGVLDPGEPELILPSQIKMKTSGFPGDATAGLGGSAVWSSSLAQFNARGLPCVASGGQCSNIVGTNTYRGFKYYLQGDSSFGPSGWAAVTVTPAGRIKATLYTGSGGYQ